MLFYLRLACAYFKTSMIQSSSNSILSHLGSRQEADEEIPTSDDVEDTIRL